MISKKGRKQKYSESFAKNILVRYIEENKYIKRVNYKDVQTFILELKKNGELEDIPEISYWRKDNRTGGKIIKEYNETYNKSNEDEDIEIENYNFLSTMQNKFKNDSDYKILESFLNKRVVDNKKVYHDNQKLKEKLSELESEVQKSKKRNEQSEELLINIYHFLIKDQHYKMSPFFKKAFNDIFDNPYSFSDFKLAKELESKGKGNTIRKLFENKLDDK